MDVTTAAQVVDEVFEAAPELAPVPGAAYGLVRDGRLVHAGGRGQAWVGGPTPGADTVFRIASMTKSFTAAAVLLLRDEGALRLDDPLTQFLPAAATIGAPDGPVITIRDLLTMGAGLATDDPWGDRQESLPPADFDALVAGGLSFCRPPRTSFEYANTGYALLGRVIEEITGTTYPAFVIDRVCSPLGMTSTGFDPREVAADRLALGYRIDAHGTPVLEPTVTPGAYSAMGGLLSTVSDLAVWVSGWMAAWSEGLDAHPVDRWSLREAQELARFAGLAVTTGPGAGTAATGYGFGLMVEEHGVLGRIVSHSGGYPGYGSHMRWHPRSGWGIVALGNSSYAPMSVVAGRALARLVVESEAAHGSNPSMPVVPWPQTLAAMTVAEDLLAGRPAHVTDENWSPNMDLDVPRDERLALLAGLRDLIGSPSRVDGTVEHPTPGRASWTVTGDAGSARLEVWMTPERVPRIQKLTATRAKEPTATT